MRKGLKLTLMTVAVAMLGIQAMAMAPVIQDLPSPIVGSAGTVTGPNRFVYPDAFDLTAYVTDDNTAASAIKWSYEVSGTPKYNINGVAPINSASENPVTPGAKQINNQDLDPQQVDNNPQTVTIRNVNLSPISGTQTDPSTTGILDSETQLLTLYASDGTTYTLPAGAPGAVAGHLAKSMFVYTDNGGSDRMSQGTVTNVPVATYDYEGNTDGWSYSMVLTATSGTSGNTAVCLTVPTGGDSLASWVGPFDIQLVANNVYHVRAAVSGSQSSPSTTPMWDIYFNNFTGSQGANLFGGELMFYDGDSGGNSAMTTGKNYDLWWAPMPVSSPAWNDPSTGAPFGTTDTNVQLVFRELNLGAARNSDLGLGSHIGTICLTNCTVERYPLNSMVAGTQLYAIDATAGPGFVAANSGGTGSILVSSLLGTNPTIDMTGGVLTVTPTSPVSVELVNIDPGADLAFDLSNGSTILDNYPVVWQSNKLLQITAELTAPNATAQSDPPDAIQIGTDTPGNEIITQSFITRLGNGASALCGMPKTSGYVPYMAFVYTHNETSSTKSWYHRMRPRLSLINNTGVTSASTSGGFRCRSLKVTEVTFPGMP